MKSLSMVGQDACEGVGSKASLFELAETSGVYGKGYM